MGCDIHAYVEYSRDGKSWGNLTRNAGSRNYLMFGILAGVRAEDEMLFEPKGMPDGDIGYYTYNDYWLHVAPDNHPQWADSDGYTSLENAERWIANKSSQPDYRDGKLLRVTHPDWHSHSWLTAEELERAVDRYRSVVLRHYHGASTERAPSEWVGMLGAMKAIEANGDQTRVVFWFDN